MSLVRKEVLSEFRQLHRLAKKVFSNDIYALTAAKKRITDDFKKNKHVKNQESIQELINLAKDVRNELKTNVIQAKEKSPGTGIYELVINEETTKLDNVPFNQNITYEPEDALKPRRKCK